MGEVASDPNDPTTAETGPTMSDTMVTVSDTVESDTQPTTDDTGGCPAGSEPPVPGLAEWDGPFILMPSGAPGCPDALVGEQELVFSEPMVGANCPCTCQASCEAFSFPEAENGCGQAGSPIAVPGNGCLDLEESSRARKNGFGAGVACDSPFSSSPPITFAGSHRVCAGTQGECIPVPPDAFGPCVRRSGDHECEQPELQQHIVTMTDVQVECENCQPCNNQLDNACAAGMLRVHDDVACADVGSLVGGNNCSVSAGAAVSMSIDLTCPSTTTSSQTRTNVMTYCCAQ